MLAQHLSSFSQLQSSLTLIAQDFYCQVTIAVLAGWIGQLSLVLLRYGAGLKLCGDTLTVVCWVSWLDQTCRYLLQVRQQFGGGYTTLLVPKYLTGTKKLCLSVFEHGVSQRSVLTLLFMQYYYYGTEATLFSNSQITWQVFSHCSVHPLFQHGILIEEWCQFDGKCDIHITTWHLYRGVMSVWWKTW